MSVKFEDYSVKVIGELNDAIISGLYAAAGEIASAAARNSPIDTGQLKNSWSYKVDESAGKATIGSPLENALWEEFGTGEYALQGNGRKGGWRYQDRKGEWHFTKGKKPQRTLHKAFIQNKGTIKKIFEGTLKEL